MRYRAGEKATPPADEESDMSKNNGRTMEDSKARESGNRLKSFRIAAAFLVCVDMIKKTFIALKARVCKDMLLKEVYKVTIQTPPSSVKSIMNGLQQIDPLEYGRYQSVYFEVKGNENFSPQLESNPSPVDGVSPSIGSKNRLESIKIEFYIPRDRSLLSLIINQGIIPNHEWETPVIAISEETCVVTSLR